MRLRKQKAIKEGILLILLLVSVMMSYWLAQRTVWIREISSHTISPTTKSLLAQLDKTPQIILFTQDIDLSHQVETLIKHYQLSQPIIEYQWQRQNYTSSNQVLGVLMITYGSQQQIIELDQALTENQLTQAFFKLERKENQWVVFLQGHDEPDPFGKENKDFSLLRLALYNQGLKSQRLNLMQTPFIPDNTQVLILASPKSELWPIEQSVLLGFVRKGGNLLWLIDPNSTAIPALSELLGVAPLPGTIVDLHGQKLGTPHPAITVIEHYGSLPFAPPNALTAFPWATALAVNARAEWQVQPLLTTHAKTWTYTGDLNGQLVFDPNKQVSGPLLLGVGLSRNEKDQILSQRTIVIGNSRFLSNGAIENYGNLALGLNIMNWLAHDDALLQIEQPVVQDTLVQIPLITALLIQYGFPLLNLFGLMISFAYFYRRHRIAIGSG